jgi:hypothetical protein
VRGLYNRIKLQKRKWNLNISKEGHYCPFLLLFTNQW